MKTQNKTQPIQAQLPFDKLSPYIPLSEYGNLNSTDIESAVLKDALKNIVIRQLDYAISKLKNRHFDSLPKLIGSLA